MITIALLGNPNVGKTTLFNALTGSRQYVGNWPGVTVEKKEGYLDDDIKIVDLPGIYAMDTFSNEEVVSKDFLLKENVDLIINIVDASNLSRNLYLTTQLKKFKIPMLLVLNMMDVAENKGIKIDTKSLAANFNIEVMPMMASKKIGIDHIKSKIRQGNFSLPLNDNDYEFLDETAAYSFIDSIISQSLAKDSKKVSKSVSNNMDKILLNPWLAYPIFIAFMFLMFKVTFSWIGQPLSDLLGNFVANIFSPYIEGLLYSSSPWFSSLMVQGIIGGVGGVIVFVPIIFTLFFCISLLEDSGYMARIAFLMDKIMRKLGLSGKAFIPFIVGFGCSVPAIMSARTLESDKDRKMAALLAPLMSCNARLPVYALFAGMFFPNNTGLVVASLYLLGVILAILIGILFKNTIFKKDEEPFIIELPEYKLPDIKSIFILTWDKGKGFLKKAGTIIFAMSIVIWFLSHINFSGYVEDPSHGFLASIGSFISPIFAPLGFGNWQSSVAILTGIVAKESVVSTIEVVFSGGTEILPMFFNSLSAYSFMTFILIYTPCIAVISTMKKEFGRKMMYFSIFYQLVLAWIVSFLVYNIGGLILNII